MYGTQKLVSPGVVDKSALLISLTVPGFRWSQTKGALFWDYSVDSYSGIRITEHTEYQFPKEQTLCYSENRIADVTKIKAMRPRKSRTPFYRRKTGENCQKNTITGYTVYKYSKQTAIPSIQSILLS